MNQATDDAARPVYGYDAPGIMLGRLMGGCAAALTGCVTAAFATGVLRYTGVVVVIIGTAPLFSGLCMLLYAVSVKFARASTYPAWLTSAETALSLTWAGGGPLLIGAASERPEAG